MSLYSEHAANVNRLTERIAEIEAEKIRRKGDLIGGSLALLGQLPLAVQQGRRQAQQDALQQQRETRLEGEEQRKAAAAGEQAATLRQLSDRLRVAKTPVEVEQVWRQFDPQKADTIRDRNINAGAQILQNSTAGNWDQALQAIKKYVPPELASSLPDSYPDTPDFSWKVQTVRDWTSTPKDYLAANTPKPAAAPTDFTLGPGQQRFDPTGKPLASVPAAERPAAATPNPTEATFARDAQNPDPAISGPAKAALATMQKQHPPAQSGTNALQSDDVDAIADAIIAGEQPPTLTGLYRNAAPVRAALARKGYDLATATSDWQATQRHLTTANGAQQTRLRQGINALPDLLDSVEALAGQWKGGRFPLLNKANLLAAEQGAYGDQVASVAKQLRTQIADVTADLGNVYMGGNSPTDHALQLAGTALSADWSEKVLRDMIALARKNVQIRRNSINNTGVAGASAQNPYAVPQAAPAEPAAPSTGAPSYQDYLRSRGQR